MQYILAIDQGTSSTKTIIFDTAGQPVARGIEPLKTNYLNNDFVEQDPEEIYQNVLASVQQCLNDFKAKGGNIEAIKAIGISNQRETFVVWNKAGIPLHNAVVWQCKRSAAICDRLLQEGYEETIQQKTGLRIDPYFSGTKLLWLYENNETVRTAINEGNAYFGTIDTWLLYKFTNGKSYATDYTNASRTLFFNLHTLSWNVDILQKFNLSNLHLPSLQPSAAAFGSTDLNGLLPTPIGITGMIGDSHAAAFGEGCFAPGTAKATLGTGCSILMNIGATPTLSKTGMVTTICWSTEQETAYALEGVIVSCGATIEWLKNELELFTNSKDTEAMATAVPDNGGVYLIPAFSGLGSPYWQMDRRAAITGLSFGSTKNHIVRAALESIPYQIKDIIDAMTGEAGKPLETLNLNGGITSNRFVIQFLTDLINCPVETFGMSDVSALGAAFMAGLKAGIFKDINELKQIVSGKQTHLPAPDRTSVLKGYAGWQREINRYP